MASRILDVSVVNAYLKQLLETDDLLGDCWIQGEVSERFEARSGHIYFTLVEGQSTIKGVIFRGNAMRQRSPFRDGDQVVAHGRLSIYEARSQYQLIADSVQPAGQGLQALQLELLRQKLEAEGLFEPTRKRPLPLMPKTIGVVTSADGAVRFDIQHVLERRFPLARLVISPAQVQGDGAPESIVAAFERLMSIETPDVVIVGRGGGSSDDLMAFNDERVVRAIFASPVPVISAVGHETDWTLADLVADVRAPTPSAAAEIVAPSIVDLYAETLAFRGEVQRIGARRLTLLRTHIDHQQQALRRHSLSVVFDRHRPSIDFAKRRLTALAHTQLERTVARVDARALVSNHTWRENAARRHSEIDRRSAQLSALNPVAVLQRGFASLAYRATGEPISSATSVNTGDSATIFLRDGELDALVEGVRVANQQDQG